MACQPTSQVGVLYLVTIDTKFHFKVDPFDAVHGFDLTMAFLSFDIAVDMSLMVKQNMLGQVIDLAPWGRCLGIEIFMLLLNPGMIGNDIIMAVKTFLNRRQAGVVGSRNIRVAVLALNALNPCMQPVAEGNRLLRADICRRRHIEVVKEQNQQ